MCVYIYTYTHIIYILMNIFHYVCDPLVIVLSDISLANFRFPRQVTRSWLWSASMHGRRTLLCCGGSWRRKNGGSFKGFNGFQWVLFFNANWVALRLKSIGSNWHWKRSALWIGLVLCQGSEGWEGWSPCTRGVVTMVTSQDSCILRDVDVEWCWWDR